jgi:hypothetical protein
MDDQHFNVLVQIVSLGTIRHLLLDRNPMISELNYPSLIAEDSSLRILSLRGNNITDPGAKALAYALKQNRSLLSLNLFDNRIQKTGAEAIGESLRVNTVLQCLSLAKNYLGDEGLEVLCRGLLNFVLSPEEVQSRKKQQSDIERIKSDMDEESKKRGARKGLSSATKLVEKEKKANSGLKVSGTKKPEPPSQRPTKSPEDPKIKKLVQNSDDKKGVKKPATATGKSKKAKENYKDDLEDLLDVSQIEPMFEANSQWYILGNRSLNSVDVSWNGITEMGLKFLYDVVMEQDQTAEQSPDGMLGLFRVGLLVNNINAAQCYFGRLTNVASTPITVTVKKPVLRAS